MNAEQRKGQGLLGVGFLSVPSSSAVSSGSEESGRESVAAFCSADDAARARRLRVRRGVLAAVTHVLLAVLVALILLPGVKMVPTPTPFLVAVALIECCYIASVVRARGKSEAPSWIVLIVWVLLIAWELLTTQLGRLHPVLVPAPEAVFNVFATQYDVLLVNVASSVELLLVGAVTSIVSLDRKSVV